MQIENKASTLPSFSFGVSFLSASTISRSFNNAAAFSRLHWLALSLPAAHTTNLMHLTSAARIGKLRAGSDVSMPEKRFDAVLFDKPMIFGRSFSFWIPHKNFFPASPSSLTGTGQWMLPSIPQHSTQPERGKVLKLALYSSSVKRYHTSRPLSLRSSK